MPTERLLDVVYGTTVKLAWPASIGSQALPVRKGATLKRDSDRGKMGGGECLSSSQVILYPSANPPITLQNPSTITLLRRTKCCQWVDIHRLTLLDRAARHNGASVINALSVQEPDHGHPQHCKKRIGKTPDQRSTFCKARMPSIHVAQTVAPNTWRISSMLSR